jgi:hypothetical protein
MPPICLLNVFLTPGSQTVWRCSPLVSFFVWLYIFFLCISFFVRLCSPLVLGTHSLRLGLHSSSEQQRITGQQQHTHTRTHTHTHSPYTHVQATYTHFSPCTHIYITNTYSSCFYIQATHTHTAHAATYTPHMHAHRQCTDL